MTTKQKTGPKRKGHEVPCIICGTMIYRDLAYIARTKRITCRAPDCKIKAVTGENNAFWGKVHDEETRERIKAGRRANPPKTTGPKKGTFSQTPEARAKISASSKKNWEENRDKMLAARKAKEIKPRELLRYRRNFTKTQRKEWKECACAWCNATEKLVLDHIIPVMCGGVNERKNCQTLCQPCNLWKMINIDRKLYLAGLDLKVA